MRSGETGRGFVGRVGTVLMQSESCLVCGSVSVSDNGLTGSGAGW